MAPYLRNNPNLNPHRSIGTILIIFIGFCLISRQKKDDPRKSPSKVLDHIKRL